MMRHEERVRVWGAVLCGIWIGLMPGPAAALDITVSGSLGDLDASGDGNDEAAGLNAAVQCWEARITTDRDFTLNVVPASLTGGTRGQGSVDASDGDDIPTSGTIRIDNDGSTTWYADPTPLDSLEFTPDPSSPWQLINGPGGADLLRVLLHETGHALGWICGNATCGFDNDRYDAMMNPPPGSFVSAPGCAPPFPATGQPALAGCVFLTEGSAPHPLNVSLRGDGLGGSGSSVVNELSHPGVSDDLLHGIGVGGGTRQLPSFVDVDMFGHAYDDTINLPPTVFAGNDIIQECDETGGSEVTVDAGGSTDPEGDTLTYAWTCPGVALDDPSAESTSGFFPVNTPVDCRVDATDLAACTSDADDVNVSVVDTTDPSAACPTDLIDECSETGGTPKSDPQITAFLGAASASDVCDGSPSLANNAPSFFDLGATPVIFTATDDSGNQDACTADVEIVDTTPPDIACPSPVTVECTEAGGTPPDDPQLASFLDGASAEDVCDGEPVITNETPDFFENGTTTDVAFTATDDSDNDATCSASVTVEDTMAPTVSAPLSVSPAVLWPPNHKLRTITVAPVTFEDVCDPDPAIICSVESSEPPDAEGDGKTAFDIVFDGDEILTQGTGDREITSAGGTGTFSLQLRAERSGIVGTREYTIRCFARDADGNESAPTEAVVRVAL